MKKVVVCTLASCVAVLALVAASASSALAIAPFKKEFDNLYVKKEGGTPPEQKLAEAVKTAKCDICHMGEKKKERNAYGQALAKLLDKKTDKDNVEKIRASLKQVESEHSDPKDEKSPTFGDLIKEGKLPAVK
jgi:hypothetical protein